LQPRISGAYTKKHEYSPHFQQGFPQVTRFSTAVFSVFYRKQQEFCRQNLVKGFSEYSYGRVFNNLLKNLLTVVIFTMFAGFVAREVLGSLREGALVTCSRRTKGKTFLSS
jgi:hypothetical protein